MLPPWLISNYPHDVTQCRTGKRSTPLSPAHHWVGLRGHHCLQLSLGPTWKVLTSLQDTGKRLSPASGKPLCRPPPPTHPGWILCASLSLRSLAKPWCPHLSTRQSSLKHRAHLHSHIPAPSGGPKQVGSL